MASLLLVLALALGEPLGGLDGQKLPLVLWFCCSGRSASGFSVLWCGFAEGTRDAEGEALAAWQALGLDVLAATCRVRYLPRSGATR